MKFKVWSKKMKPTKQHYWRQQRPIISHDTYNSIAFKQNNESTVTNQQQLMATENGSEAINVNTIFTISGVV